MPMQPAPLTGTATGCRLPKLEKREMMQPAPLTGTATASGSISDRIELRCSPHPSRGQQPFPHGAGCGRSVHRDAARTPHGDSNQIPAYPTQSNIVMQPVPFTGTKKRETRNSSVSCLPFYISACSLTSLFHIAEEGYAGILCHSPCAAGFRCVLRGRRQFVYILSLYLSYVK